MVTREDVESYLDRMEVDYEEVDEGMWVVRANGDDTKIVLNHTPPVLVFRIKVLDLPQDESRCAALYRRLLQLNAADLVHGAYGLEEEDIILSETMELENLDFNEFQATVDSISMAVASHLEELSEFRGC
jgi:hypothetical protein